MAHAVRLRRDAVRVHHRVMLTSLLPGFRHVRTPFAIGVLCAFQLWMLFGDAIPTQEEANGLMERVYSLTELTGRPIMTSAVAFMLYLLGDILKLPAAATARFVASLAALRLRLGGNWSRLDRNLVPITPRTYHIMHELADRIREDGGGFPKELMINMERELPEIRMRLIADHLDVYLEHDRLSSEAEFRINVGIFSVPLWGSLSAIWSPWALIGITLSAVLFLHGVRALQDSNTVLVQGISAGIVESRAYKDQENKVQPQPHDP